MGEERAPYISTTFAGIGGKRKILFAEAGEHIFKKLVFFSVV